MAGLLERIYNLPIGVRCVTVGGGITDAEKEMAAEQLGRALAGEKHVSKEFLDEAPAHELNHALNAPGTCKFSYDKNIFKRIIAAHTEVPENITWEQLYVSALSGANKETGGYIELTNGVRVAKTMTSQGDINIAAKAAKHLTTEQVHALNRKIWGKSYDPIYLKILGFKTKDS